MEYNNNHQSDSTGTSCAKLRFLHSTCKIVAEKVVTYDDFRWQSCIDLLFMHGMVYYWN